jgi:hypothetical protein
MTLTRKTPAVTLLLLATTLWLGSPLLAQEEPVEVETEVTTDTEEPSSSEATTPIILQPATAAPVLAPEIFSLGRAESAKSPLSIPVESPLPSTKDLIGIEVRTGDTPEPTQEEPGDTGTSTGGETERPDRRTRRGTSSTQGDSNDGSDEKTNDQPTTTDNPTEVESPGPVVIDDSSDALIDDSPVSLPEQIELPLINRAPEFRDAAVDEARNLLFLSSPQPFLPWTHALTMDDQHRNREELVNRLAIACAEGESCACPDCTPIVKAIDYLKSRLLDAENALADLAESKARKLAEFDEKFEQANELLDQGQENLQQIVEAIAEMQLQLFELTGSTSGGAVMTPDLSFTPIPGWPEYPIGNGRSVWARTPEALDQLAGAMAAAGLEWAIGEAQIAQGEAIDYLNEVHDWEAQIYDAYALEAAKWDEMISAKERFIARINELLDKAEADLAYCLSCSAVTCPDFVNVNFNTDANVDEGDGQQDGEDGTGTDTGDTGELPAPPAPPTPPSGGGAAGGGGAGGGTNTATGHLIESVTEAPPLPSAEDIERARQNRIDQQTALLEDLEEYQAEMQADLYEALEEGNQSRIRQLQDEMDFNHDRITEILTELRLPDLVDSELRYRLIQEVHDQTREAVRAQIASDETIQDVKKVVTAGTRYVSVGSQLQNDTERATRSALREVAYAVPAIEFVASRLDDPTLTSEERKIYSDYLEILELRLRGASDLLSTNGTLTTIGYVTDGVLLLTGGKIAHLISKGLGRAAGTKAATATGSRVVASEAATQTTARTATRGGASSTGRTSVAEAATPRAPGSAPRAPGSNAGGSVPRPTIMPPAAGWAGKPTTISEVRRRLTTVNQGFGRTTGADINCGFCVETVENILRGLTPTTTPTGRITWTAFRETSEAATSRLPTAVRNSMNATSQATAAAAGAAPTGFLRSTAARITEFMSGVGPGSTGRVWVRRADGGHIINVWVDDLGQVFFIDGQSGAITRTLQSVGDDIMFLFTG